LRLVDLSTAVLVGLLSASTLMTWSPAPYQAASQDFDRQAGLSDLLVQIINAGGLVWIQGSSFASVCARLSSYSNSSVTVSATEGASSCLPEPSRDYVQSTLALPFPSGQVTLIDWEGVGP